MNGQPIWWHVNVEYDSITDEGKGKPKKIKEEFLVHAINPTDIDVIVTKEMVEAGITDFTFKPLKPTKIIKILTKDGELTPD